MSANAGFDTLDEPVRGQLRQKAFGLLAQVDEASVPVQPLLLGPEEFNEDPRLASGQLVEGVAGGRQVHQRQAGQDVGVGALGRSRADRAHLAL